MPDNNNFNELLIHTLKQIHVRLDRLDVKLDEKADRADVKALSAKLDEKADKADVKAVEQRLGGVENRLDSVESRLDRIESGIGTLKWVIGVGLTAMSVLIALLKIF